MEREYTEKIKEITVGDANGRENYRRRRMVEGEGGGRKEKGNRDQKGRGIEEEGKLKWKGD